MIIQHVARICYGGRDNVLFGKDVSDNSCVRNTAFALDWIAALALLIIGILGACGVLHLAPALTYSFLGAGVVYTIVMIMHSSLQLKIRCSN